MSQSQDPASLPAPDWQYWSAREEWQILDGAVLLTDVEPRSEPGERFKAALSLPAIDAASDPIKHARHEAAHAFKKTYLSDSEGRRFLRALDVYTNARAAVRRGKLSGHLVTPDEFLKWAFDRDYVVPPAIEVTKNAEFSTRWGVRQLWTLMETAHLLCNLEPVREATAQTVRGPVADWYRDLKDAITLQQLTHYEPRTGNMPDTLLRPQDVETWARDKNRVIPQWVSTLAPPQPSRAELVARILELESLIAQPTVPAASEDDVEVGERKTLDTLSAYFARRYAYDPEEPKSDAPGKVRMQLESVGLKLHEKTIRKIMLAGLKRFPPEGDSKIQPSPKGIPEKP